MATEGTEAGFSCTTCGGNCSLETDRRGAPQIKCHDCGAQFEIILAPLPRAKWTLVGPSGKLASFASTESLRDAVDRTIEFGTTDSLPILVPGPTSSENVVAVAESSPTLVTRVESSPKAASALLDEIDGVVSSRNLVPDSGNQEEDDDDAMRVETKEIFVVDLLSTTPTAPFEKKHSLLVDKKATPTPPPPDSEDEVEPVSLTDVLEIRQVLHEEVKRSVPPAVTRASQTPGPTNPSAAPKPHSGAKLALEVESEPRVPVKASVDGATSTQTDRPRPSPKPPKRDDTVPPPPRNLRKPETISEPPGPTAPKDSAPPSKRSSGSARPSALASLDGKTSSGSSRGWVIGVGLVAVVAAGAAYARYGGTPNPTPPPVASAEVPPTPKASPTPMETTSTDPVATSVAAPSVSVPPVGSVPIMGSGMPAHARVDESRLPVNEILHRAHDSMATKDYAKARERFDHALAASPGNAEAYAGLGDIARVQGDLARAKDSYSRALQTSPHYLPAELALADIRWDSGERAEAQKLYAGIVDRLGSGAPERARTRSAAALAPAPAPAPAPSATAATP